MNRSNKIKIYLFILLGFTGIISSCKKLVEIPPPNSTISTSQVFADSTDANSAILGIYGSIAFGGGTSHVNGFETLFCGMSADELLPFQSQADQFSTNILAKDNTIIYNDWGSAYSLVYQTNASIEGIQASIGISPSAKSHLIGEVKFLRAFFYFYLVNLYGDVPYINGSDYKINALAARTSKAQVYDNIVNDLLAAQSSLSGDYSYSGGERVRANSLSATALLARVYLYLNRWADAATAATSIINNNNFKLNSDLNQTFLRDNQEAILQWSLNGEQNTNVTSDGQFIPYDHMSPPTYYLTPQLLKSFEPDDKRRLEWVDSTIYNGVTYYYPFKYKISLYQQSPGAPATEYYMVLRLAEQYLIRAEAEANGATGGLNAAIADLNVIRNRAGLANYAGDPSNKQAVLDAIMHERRIELFSEWGHRWFDLKRTGTIDAVLKPIKPKYQSYQQLYPIPFIDIQADPNLTQNPGYN